MYLYRISTKKGNVWCKVKPKPIYLVVRNKKEVLKWAGEYLHRDLSLSRVTCLGKQVAGNIFTGN